MAKKLYSIIIMDGFGINDDKDVSAILQQGTPCLDRLCAEYPNAQIGASGLSVGLPDGQMGNSEVGHLNIGAGRIIYQELTRITKSISDGDFFENPELLSAVSNAKERGTALHLYGLLSDGGVHSHNTHLYALLDLARREGLSRVYVHCFLDGRDVSPTSGAGFIEELQSEMNKLGIGKIATVTGRFYAMDRDNRWERVEKAYKMLTEGEGIACEDAAKAVRDSYEAGVTDEFVLPTVVCENGAPVAKISAGDSVIFFNFRPDRAREITRTFTQKDFDAFPVKKDLGLTYVCFTEYDATFKNVLVAFKPESYENTLGEYLAKCGKTQVRIAETEKYAHVTFFFNGGVEKPNDNEDRILVPSPKVKTYDLKPSMSAYEVCDKATQAVRSGKYDVLILNFANCDMVGHTGIMQAAEEAVKTVDECVGKLVSEIVAAGGEAIITADHGNADQMIAEDGSPFTAHTTNLVPVILVSERLKDATLRSGGILADLSPTLLDMMGLEQPLEMTGKSLIEK